MTTRLRPSLVALLLLAPGLAACQCETPAPTWPGQDAEGTTRVVEAAQPEGGAVGTVATSDLTVPPREGDLGWWVSLALDSKDRPHLAYTDAYEGELHYAEWSGGAFRVVRVDVTGAVGKYTAIAVGPDDRPHILYYNQDNRRLLYATYVGKDKVDPEDRRTPYAAAPGWMFEVVDEGLEIGMASRLEADPDGSLHAFYYTPDERLIHAARPPTKAGVHANWHREVVDPKAGGSHSIVLGYARGADGTRHLSYSNFNVVDSELRYARLAPGAKKWELTSITKEDNAGWKSGIALDDAGRPVIAYLALQTRQLRLARPGETSGSWHIEPLVGNANGMAFHRAPGGSLVLAYEHLPGEGLAGATVRYLSRPDMKGELNKGWSRHDLVGSAVSSYLALALTSKGLPVIAWYDGGIRGVRLWTSMTLPEPPAKPEAPAAPPPAEAAP